MNEINKFISIIKNKNVEYLKDFINKGANINIQNNNVKINEQNNEFYKSLIDNKYKWTPIMYAIQYKSTECFKELLRRNANVNICEQYGLSPLAIATFYGDIHYIDLLIKYNADVNIGNIKPIHIACDIGNILCLYFILKYITNIDVLDINNNTPLMYACKRGHLEIVKILINSNANINFINKDGKTALMECMSYLTNTECIQLLIDNKCNINYIDNNGQTALTKAVLSRNIMAALILLKNGADVNIIDKDGKSLLMHLCKEDNRMFIKLLVWYGININVIDNMKNTALIYFCRYGYTDCINILLSTNKCYVDHCNSYGINAFMVANFYKHNKCIDLLIKYKVNTQNYNDTNFFPFLYLLDKVMEQDTIRC